MKIELSDDLLEPLPSVFFVVYNPDPPISWAKHAHGIQSTPAVAD